MIISGNTPAHVQQAVDALCTGELLGLPTETVYGLAADASNETAVAKIFQAKGRPANHPLIVHVASANFVQKFASEVPDFAQKLMAQFWPGPLTLILLRREEMAAAATISVCRGKMSVSGPGQNCDINFCAKSGT